MKKSAPTTETLQLTLDPAVSPARILLGHPDNQPSDGVHEAWAAYPLGLRGESLSLIIGQPELAAFQLFCHNPVLFDPIADHVLLVAVHPAENREEQHLKWVRIGSY